MTTTLANVRARAHRYAPSLLAFAASGVFSIRNDGGDSLEEIDDADIAEYRERQAKLAADSEAIYAKAKAEKREPTGEELNLVKENSDEIDRLRDLIERRATHLRQIGDIAKPKGRLTTPTGPAPGATATPQAAANPPAFQAARDLGSPARHSRTQGFAHFGEFSMAVKRACVRGGSMDPRLQMALTTFGSESVGADGGFLVPPEERDRILSALFAAGSLLARTDQQIASRNIITFPADETTPWGATGVQGFWTAEAGAITQSKPSLKKLTLDLNKLAALIPVTDELLEDTAALGNFLSGSVGRVFDYLISNAIISGDGVGKPLGYLQSGALVTQAAEGGQTPDTVVAANVTKMYSRMPEASRQRAVWIVNPDVEPQLLAMVTGSQAVYLPPGTGLSQSPFATLMGRPVIQHMAAKALGDVGDITFADLLSYVTAVKSGGALRADTSIHLFFDQDVVAFRFILRIDGRPWLTAPFTPPNGVSTLSPFVALAAR